MLCPDDFGRLVIDRQAVAAHAHFGHVVDEHGRGTELAGFAGDLLEGQALETQPAYLAGAPADAGLEVDHRPPVGAEAFSACKPVYEEMPGWKESTVGIKEFEQLPQNARNYLKRIEEVTGVPVDIISTGPDRNETIVLRHPFV